MANVLTANTSLVRGSESSGLVLPDRFSFDQPPHLNHADGAMVQLPALNLAERAVMQRWGPAALENLYQLGERIQREPAFAKALLSVSRIDSPVALQLLAHQLPDLLLSAHTLNTVLGDAVDPIFYRGLPQTGAELSRVALELTRFNLRELSKAIEVEANFSPYSGNLSLFSQLSASQIAQFGDAQLAAYKARLAIQPGGKDILDALERGPRDSGNGKLARIITVQTLEQLRELGAPTLRLIRHLSREHQAVRWSRLSEYDYASGPITSLTDDRGKQLYLSPTLVETMSQVHHLAWLEAGTLIHNARPAGNSIQAIPSQLSEDQRRMYLKNLNAVAALTLTAQIGTLPDKLFDRIVEIADPVKKISESRELTAAITTEVSDAPVNTSILARRLEYPEILKEINLFKTRADNELLAQDLQVSNRLLTRIDGLSEGIDGKEYLQLIGELRTLHIRRSYFTEMLNLGLLSIPAARQAELLLDGPIDVSVITKHIVKDCDDRWRPSLEGTRRQYISACQRMRAFPETELPRGFQGTQLLTPASLELRFSELSALIRDNSGKALSLPASSDERGKLLPADYSLAYFKRLLADGNHVLFRSKGEAPGSGIDGLFIYFRPENFPGSIRELKSAISPVENVAYESLFLTAKDRTPGTYLMLLRGMGARQALAGVRYSMGTVLESDQYHADLLQRVEHYPLHAAPIILDANGARFRPMLWRMP